MKFVPTFRSFLGKITVLMIAFSLFSCASDPEPKPVDKRYKEQIERANKAHQNQNVY